MTFELRDYQERSIDEIRGAYKAGKRAPLLCSPTGSGKSSTLGYMLGSTKKRTLILAHREQLVRQISESLPVRHGIIMPGHPRTDDQIQVGMMQTVVRRLDKLPKFEWVISDEAHLAVCPTWLQILKYYGNSWHLGMSATPCRLDGKGLKEHYDEIVFGPSVTELTARGFLVPYRAFGAPERVGKIKMAGSDYAPRAAADEFSKPAIIGNAVSHMKKHAPDRLNLVFCCDREHAALVAAEFNAKGIPAANIDGSMDRGEQKRLVGLFKSGALRVLTNVDLLTTGFDCPEISALTFLRRTTSLSLYLQMTGRGLRPAPGKRDLIIFDHADNMRLGFPDDDFAWSLDGDAPKEKKDDVEAGRQCPSCFAIHKPAPACPECGQTYKVKQRTIEEVDGELAEIDKSAIERAREVPLREVLRGVRSAVELRSIARERGYSSGWVFHQCKIRNIPLSAA